MLSAAKHLKARTLLTLAVSGAILSACSNLPFGLSGMSYVDAEERLNELVEGGLRAGLRDEEVPAEPTRWDEICTDSNLAPTGDVYPTRTFHFPLELLGAHKVGFVDRVADFWKAQGLTLDPDNEPEGIIGMFATSSEGFALEAFVNERTGMVLVTGSGPCVEKVQSGQRLEG
jgi:hypothetical protein